MKEPFKLRQTVYFLVEGKIRIGMIAKMELNAEVIYHNLQYKTFISNSEKDKYYWRYSVRLLNKPEDLSSYETQFRQDQLFSTKAKLLKSLTE